MANTYSQIHIHTVFAVQNRQSLIQKEWQEDLYQYITGIVKGNQHKMLQINGMPDHIHLLIGMRPHQALSDLMKVVKGESSQWVNQKQVSKHRFSWQSGYGAFSYAKSQVPKVIQYIQNQQQHHKKKSFTEEYIDFLNAFEVDYDNHYVFKPVL